MKRALGFTQAAGKAPYAIAASAAIAIAWVAARTAGTAMRQDLLPLCREDVTTETTVYDYPFLAAPEERVIPAINLKDGLSYKIDSKSVLYPETLYCGPERGVVEVRSRMKIRGKGTLYWPEISNAQIHLMPGVKLVTSGRYQRSRQPLPPKDANVTNGIYYASYIVEPGAELVFTDNPDYPESLIERR